MATKPICEHSDDIALMKSIIARQSLTNIELAEKISTLRNEFDYVHATLTGMAFLEPVKNINHGTVYVK